MSGRWLPCPNEWIDRLHRRELPLILPVSQKTEKTAMAESERQKRVTGRVMHEFKHGELKSGPGGKGGPVKSRRQAIAIALEEAGASKNESDRGNQRNLHRTERK